IGRDRHDPTRVSLDTDTPRDAVTHFAVDRLWSAHALLRVRLETGRMHQIRVHLAAIDLPVVGDPVYGARDPALGRQFLHAAELAFPHPFGGERVETRSGLPEELAGYLARLDQELPCARPNVPRPGGRAEADGGRRIVVCFPPRPPASTVAPETAERGTHARRLHEGA